MSERHRFLADGFLALPGFFDGDDLAELRGQVQRFVDRNLPRLPREHVFYEDVDDATTCKQVQQLGQHDAWFRTLCSSGRLRALAELLLDGPVVPRNVQYFAKPPGIGAPTPPHQDGFYFMLEPSTAVTLWIALDPVDEENGCVRYVRGSHRRGLREHQRTQTLGFSQAIADYPQEVDVQGETACPAAPGDLLVHHALTIHRADGNRSAARPRRALGFIYYGENAREDSAAHAGYQRALATRLKTEGRI